MKYKKIKSLKQYTKYCDEYESLILKGYKKDLDVIELLEILIEEYDNRTIEAIGLSNELEPVELLKLLMDEHNLSKSELARKLNVSRQLITEIVNYKRNISKRMVMMLSNYFNVRPIAFSRNYDLKGKKLTAA